MNVKEWKTIDIYILFFFFHDWRTKQIDHLKIENFEKAMISLRGGWKQEAGDCHIKAHILVTEIDICLSLIIVIIIIF